MDKRIALEKLIKIKQYMLNITCIIKEIDNEVFVGNTKETFSIFKEDIENIILNSDDGDFNIDLFINALNKEVIDC